MASINDEYEKLQIIGQGSFATIWKVRHRKYGYIRTLKILNTPVQDENDHAYQQFVKECTVLLNIGNGSNNNIVHIYQPRLIDNRAVVEMDYIDGETLDQYLRRNKFMPIDEVLRFIGDIGGALAYCHHDIYKYMMNPNEDDLKSDPDDGRRYIIDEATEQRLVRKYAVTHNDLHSNNVMRRENDGSYVLLDFGLAIQNGTAVKSSALRGGALEYMAPEKFDDNNVITTQSDIYSFGVLMYEALAGRVPFVLDQRRFSSNPVQAQYDIMQQHKTALPPSIEALRGEAFQKAHPGQVYKKDYPDWLEAMIKKCLEKKPADRYADAKELMEDFKRCPKDTRADNQQMQDLQKELIQLTAQVQALQNENKRLLAHRQPHAAATPNPQPVAPSEEQWVDLGLPSGTLWKNQNETNPNDSYDIYTYDEAVQQFGDQLPTKEQFEELTKNCTYVWDKSARGCWFYGPNGNSIFLPASGYRNCNGDVNYVGSSGYYWSSTPGGGLEYACGLGFISGGVGLFRHVLRCNGQSVRLVQD